MRLTLLTILLFAMMIVAVSSHAPGTAACSRGAYGERVSQTGEVAVIESYCKGIDSYAKSNPQAMLYFVNKPPGEQASGEVERRWYAVKSEAEMSEAERLYATESISALVRSGQIVYARIGEPAEHSRHDNGYYFRADGTLAKIISSYRSNAESIAIERQSFYSANGARLQSTARCFEIVTTSKGSKEKSVPCARERMKGEINDYKFPVYKRSSDLPGYALLKPS